VILRTQSLELPSPEATLRSLKIASLVLLPVVGALAVRGRALTPFAPHGLGAIGPALLPVILALSGFGSCATPAALAALAARPGRDVPRDVPRDVRRSDRAPARPSRSAARGAAAVRLDHPARGSAVLAWLLAQARLVELALSAAAMAAGVTLAIA
jgi:hypothetical protein